MTPVQERSAAAPAEAPKHEVQPMAAIPEAVPPASGPVETSPAPAAAQPPEPSAVAAPAPAPAAVRTPPAPVAKVDLDQALQASGLQLVETRFKAEIVPEPAFVPAKRERRPPPSSFNEPLQQVETGGKGASQPPA